MPMNAMDLHRDRLKFEFDRSRLLPATAEKEGEGYDRRAEVQFVAKACDDLPVPNSHPRTPIRMGTQA